VIWDLLKTPSGFEDDWKGYVRNQLGHSYLLGALPVFIFGVEALFITLPLYLTWEAIQLHRFEAQEWDSLEDTAFFLLGGLVPLFPALVVVQMLFILSGVMRRG
jgi:hypothetical protein